MPEEPKLSWPGLCFASAISSLTDFAPRLDATTRISGVLAIWVMPAKSLTGS